MDSINNACKLGGDAWLELQAFKSRQLNRREKLNRHKKLIGSIPEASSPALRHWPTPAKLSSSSSSSSTSSLLSSASNGAKHTTTLTTTVSNILANTKLLRASDAINLDLVECLLLLKLCDVALKLPIDSLSLQSSICKIRGLESTTKSLVENLLQKFAHQELISIEEPSQVAGVHLQSAPASSQAPSDAPRKGVRLDDDHELCIYVTSADHSKLVEFDRAFATNENIRSLLAESRLAAPEEPTPDPDEHNKRRHSLPDQDDKCKSAQSSNQNNAQQAKLHTNQLIDPNEDLESLLSLSSTKERESKKLGEELLELLSKPTAKERNLLERFRSADGYQVQEFCPKGTKGECKRKNNGQMACDKLHFKKIIAKHTEESLGDCSFLNTCFHMDSCKYVHYEVDYDHKSGPHFKRPHPNELASSIDCNSNLFLYSQSKAPDKAYMSPTILEKSMSPTLPLDESTVASNSASLSINKLSLSTEEQALVDAKNRKRFKTVLYPPQWIQCDLRFFDMSLLGKFSVVMADPPWDIHMELPYGTMSDDEMRKLNVPALQDEGVIFLWVTGRAMELGRECLALWGYERCDEIIWVKTNQLQRIIRTGRTGHWLNHGKEHCLVGVKGNPKGINRGLDCDVIVAEVRATSHKPDEIYGIIERLSPGTRKIELFGRAHNVQPNWITLGNQLNGVRLIEPDLVNAFKKLNLPFQTST